MFNDILKGGVIKWKKVELLYTDKNNDKYLIETFDESSEYYYEELYGYIDKLLVFKFDGEINFLSELEEVRISRALVRGEWNQKDEPWGSCYDIPLEIVKHMVARHRLEIKEHQPIKGWFYRQ